MGKIRTKIIGSDEEGQQKKRDEARRGGKKAKKESASAKISGRAPGGKGGERLPVVGQTEEELASSPAQTPILEEKAEIKSAKKTRKKKFTKSSHSKRFEEALKQVDRTKLYAVEDSVKLLKKVSVARFNGTVELHINTTEKGLRGTVNLPHGTGKKIRVVIADDNIISEIEKGRINFDILVAHPSLMGKVAKVARILGPKGLMPNPKAGTVTDTPEKKVKELEAGQMTWKTEVEHPIIHTLVGKLEFPDEHLVANIKAFIDAVGINKIKSVTLKSTMSPGLKLKV